jgi:hypothetical protein
MPTIPKSENGGLAPELAAAVSGARKALGRFRSDDEEYARGRGPRPDFQSACYELAAILNNLLRLIDPPEESKP